MKKNILSFLFFLLWLQPSFGQKDFEKSFIYCIDSKSDEINIPSQYFHFFVDSTNQFSFKDFQNAKTFQVDIFGKSLDPKPTYWAKIILKNCSNASNIWAIMLGNNFLNEVDFYLAYNDTLIQKKSGAMVPSGLKEVKSIRAPILRFVIEEREQVVLYIRIKNDDFKPVFLAPKVYLNTTLDTIISQQRLIQGLFQGAFLMICLYHFLIFIFTKSSIYLYYSLTTFFTILYFLNFYNFTLEYFFPNQPYIYYYIYFISTTSLNIFLFLFFRAFLNIYSNIPLIKKVINYWLIVRIVTFLGIFIYFLWTNDYHFSHSFQRNIAYTEIILIVFIIIVCFYKKAEVAFYLLIGISFQFTGLFFSLWFAQSLGPDFSNIFYEGGVFLQMMSFAITLGLKMNRNEAEKKIIQDNLIEQLRLNEEMQTNINRSLEEKVKERTIQLRKRNRHISKQKKMLQASEKSLKKMNQLKDKLFSIISHDLRGPLNTLQGLIIMGFQEDMSSEDFMQFLPTIKRNVDGSLNLLDNMLYWSKNQLDGMPIQIRDVELTNFIDDLLLTYQITANQKNVLILNNIQHPIQIHTDNHILHLILRNLIENAIKYSKSEGKININASIAADYITLSVADSGIGMTEEKLKTLFGDKFISSTRGTNNEKGTGLGLRVCKDFVEKLGGEIWAESQLEKGATFYFTLSRHLENLPT